jgi:hypothetical protein
MCYPGICRRQDCSLDAQGGLHVALYPSDFSCYTLYCVRGAALAWCCIQIIVGQSSFKKVVRGVDNACPVPEQLCAEFSIYTSLLLHNLDPFALKPFLISSPS